LTGFVTKTKEGTYVWDQACQYSGVNLQMGNAVLDDTNFQDLLLRHGLSDSPIRAILIGTFSYDRLRGVSKFNAERVVDARVSANRSSRTP
jgi:hypothetical protein